MKCELCQQAEAETAIQQTVKGEAREYYVCQACADRQRDAAHPSPADIVIEILIGAAQGAPMQVNSPLIRADRGLPCPRCGMTHREYHRRSRLGCSTCYSHFAQELAPLLRDMHLGPRHVGKIPHHAADLAARERLQAELNVAITQQRYEQAAVLRDQLQFRAESAPPPDQTPEDGHA